MPDLFHRSVKDQTARRLADIDSVVVIGLGRFGRSLASELMVCGTEVLGIDGDEKVVQDMSAQLTHCVRADSTNEEALRQLAVQEFDRAVVAIGTHVEASLLTASLLRNMGVSNIWARRSARRTDASWNSSGSSTSSTRSTRWDAGSPTW